VVGVEWSNVHLAGAFLIGAIVATVATLRVVRAVTNFFAGVERPRRWPRPPDQQE
jgi:hypothetical protein